MSRHQIEFWSLTSVVVGMANNAIDEFHVLLAPVAAGSGRHLFEDIPGTPTLTLANVTRFASGQLLLIYTP
jgi:dihydrofolate reductase